MPGAGGIRAGAAYVELYAENNKLVRGLRQAEAQIKAFGAKVTQVGKKMLMAAGAAAVPIAYATKTFAGFEDQMKAVQAVTGATTEKFKRLNDQAKELGRTTSFTAAEVGAGQLNLARAGFKPAEINAAIPSVLNLARATGTDLAEAAEIASGTLRAFEMDASDMAHVNDVLTATANNSATTLTDLGETMKYVAPFAAEYGMTLEGTAKAAGVLANMQIKGSMAGTGMRKALMVMSDPAIRAKLQAMGVDLSNFGDSMVGLGKIMATMTGPERIAMATEMFGARAAGAVVKLAKSDFPALSAAIDNAAGTAEESAKVMDSGLGGGFRRLMSAVEGVQIAIGEALGKVLTQYGEKLAAISGRITKWINQHKALVVLLAKTVVTVGGVGAALVVVGNAVNFLAFTLGGAALAVKGLTVALGFLLANPIVLAFAAIAAAAAAVYVAIKKARGPVKSLTESLAELKKAKDDQRAADLVLIDKLGKLSEAQSLSRDQAIEARDAITELSDRYGDLGFSVDEATGKLLGFAAAQRKIAFEQKRGKLKDQLEEQEALVKKYDRTIRRRVLGETPQLRAARREAEATRQRIKALEREYEVQKKTAALTGAERRADRQGQGTPKPAQGPAAPTPMDPMQKALQDLEEQFQKDMKAARDAGAGPDAIREIQRKEAEARKAIYAGKVPTPPPAEKLAGAVAGTFSAAAAVRLGMGGNAQERMANGIEDIKETNKQVARNTKRLLMQWTD